MSKLSIRQLEIENKRVIIRVDFNVPLSEDGKITDNSRIVAALPTIEYALTRKCSLVLMSHLGRPDGKKDLRFTLAPIALELEKLLKRPIIFLPDCIGQQTLERCSQLKPGEVLLLENLRFYPAEEKPALDPTFAGKLAQLGDVYVSDAFGAVHRKHSSITELPKQFSGKAAMGLLLEKEEIYFTTLLHSPKKPFFALIGGSKISTKLGTLTSLLDHVDALFIGGAMAYTFLKTFGIKMGSSLVEEDLLDDAKKILELGVKKNIPIHLPLDHIMAQEIDSQAKTKIIDRYSDIPDGWMGLDIGPKTIADWKEKLSKAGTILWNGPLGAFEISPFNQGTDAICTEIGKLTKLKHIITVAGGGDTVAAISKLDLCQELSHVSTGGGASLEYIENGSLPGIAVLSNNS